jgi:hypothetical protein
MVRSGAVLNEVFSAGRKRLKTLDYERGDLAEKPKEIVHFC